MQLCRLLVFLPQQLKEQEAGNAEAREGRAGRCASSPAGVWMDPEGSQGAAGRQRKPLLLLSR